MPTAKSPTALPHDFAIDARDAQQRYAELEEAARTLDRREREQLAKHHQDEREAFFDSRHQQFREARQAAYREVRDGIQGTLGRAFSRSRVSSTISNLFGMSKAGHRWQIG